MALSEDAAGRSLTLVKTGVSNTAAREVISGGAIGISNLEISTGTLQLRGPNGSITTGFGGAAPTITVNGSGQAANGNTLPSAGLLHLDSSTGHLVGATTVFAAANNNNRIVDSATLNMRSSSTLRLTSANNIGTTETIGTTNVFGHATLDLVKTGSSLTPVALTLNTLSMGANATVNFTGTVLGTAGSNLGSQFHSGNEWAKYNNTVDSGFELGATPFVAADYVVGSAENTWAAGQQVKQTAAAITLTGNRVADRFNFQATAISTFNLAGFTLTADQGGILTSASVQGFKDGATGAVPSGTAGITAGSTASPASLYVHTNTTTEFHLPIKDNLAGGAVTFVKSGGGSAILSHQGRAVNGAQVTNPFTGPTWSSTNTGGWVINDGVLRVDRGQYLGATPTTVTLNGGQLEINEPVSLANDATIIPGWGYNIVVNGNAMIGNDDNDDNGEASDASTGDRSMVRLGSLTVNNGSLLGLASFSDNDNAFMGGATFNGKASLNIGAGGRSGVNNANILSGVVAGSGFDVLALAGNGATLVLGGTQSDTTHNTYNGAVTLYAATTRLNKANGFTAITDGAASEDVVINGGNLFWGPGQHGDLATTNQAGITTAFGVAGSVAGTNNFGLLGIAPTSPAAIKNAGMNQIADTATITLLSGTLGESDRITNETFGALIMKNGTFNVGLGTVQIGSATFSGGALGFDRGGTLRIGTASYLPGAFDQSVFTGRPTAGAYTTLEYGAGGVSLTGQNITLGNGFSGNVAGAGGRLLLGGNLTFTGSDLIGGSYSRKGIFVQTGSTFRELGASHIDLMGGVRDFSIAEDSIYTITPRITNGGLSKSGNGALVMEPYERSTFAGPITVNGGILQAKGDGAFGTSAGGVTINPGGTVKLDSSWTYGDDFTVSGPGSIIPGSGSVREAGALIAVGGTSRLNGAFVLGGNATLAGDAFLDPSVTPATGGLAYRIGTLLIAGPGGITGSGALSLSGNGDGIILNGVKAAAGGLNKDGAGRWIISGPGTYVGATTVSAGTLRVTDGAALGAPGVGTTVFGGSLELASGAGISLAEPLKLYGVGAGGPSGSVVNVAGANTLAGTVDLEGNTTIRSDAGSLTLSPSATVTGPGYTLTLDGAGNGAINSALNLGAVAGDALVKNGSGAWVVTGSGGYTGTTSVNGGLLRIASGAAVLDGGSALNLGGGRITNSGPAVQTANGLNLLAGGGNVTGISMLSVGSITRLPGATAAFSGNVRALGAFNDPTGILGSYATVGSDWARVNGSSQIVAFNAYHDDVSTAAITDNARNSHYQSLTVATTANSLKLSGGSGLNIGASDLNLVAGGLLHSSSLLSGISGTGFITAGNGISDELVITTTGGTLDIATPLVGNFSTGGLTMTGNGKLVLSGSSNFSGPVNINCRARTRSHCWNATTRFPSGKSISTVACPAPASR